MATNLKLNLAKNFQSNADKNTSKFYAADAYKIRGMVWEKLHNSFNETVFRRAYTQIREKINTL